MGCRVQVGVVEDLERILVSYRQLEGITGPRVRGEHGDAVVGRVPEQRDLDAVVLLYASKCEGLFGRAAEGPIAWLPLVSLTFMGATETAARYMVAVGSLAAAAATIKPRREG